MRSGLDTNILIRYIVSSDPLHPLVRRAVDQLLAVGWELCILPQNLVELWVAVTRPATSNGYGYAPADANHEIELIEDAFTLLTYEPKTPGIWQKLCLQHGVSGKNAHDAHLAAAFLSAGVTHLLTLNKPDFLRFSELTVVTPQEVVDGALLTSKDTSE